MIRATQPHGRVRTPDIPSDGRILRWRMGRMGGNFAMLNNINETTIWHWTSDDIGFLFCSRLWVQSDRNFSLLFICMMRMGAVQVFDEVSSVVRYIDMHRGKIWASFTNESISQSHSTNWGEPQAKPSSWVRQITERSHSQANRVNIERYSSL